MKNIKEILRLASLGPLSDRQIAQSCRCSPSTVAAVLQRARDSRLDLEWPLLNQLSDDELSSKSSERMVRYIVDIHKYQEN